MTGLRVVRQARPLAARPVAKPIARPIAKPTRAKPASRKGGRKPARPLAIDDPGAPKLLLSMQEAAYALACGKSKLYDLIEAGEIVSFKVGWARRIPVASLERYVARRTAEAKGRVVASAAETSVTTA